MNASPAADSSNASLVEPEIERLVGQYTREMARYEKAASLVAEKLRKELRAEARLRHLISFRAKHPEDLREKLRRKAGDPRYRYATLRENLNDAVTDLAGCRVVVYVADDERRVVELIDRVFQSPTRDDARPPPYLKKTGYRATHRLVLASNDRDDLSVSGAICEVQVTTLAAHLFNELEHDVTYKEHGQKPSQDELAALEDVHHATRLADRLALTLLAAHRQTTSDNDPLNDAEALRFVLEREARRALSGDFVRLHRMLDGLVDPLSLTTLRGFGSVTTLLDSGRSTASRLKLDNDADDVVSFALALRPLHRELTKQAKSWRGPETLLKRALLLLPELEEAFDTSARAAHDEGSADA